MSARKLGSVSHQSLASQARDLLRQAIFEGRIHPDERLTIERIAADLGISRTPVREALKALENDGIVRIEPHRGAIVQAFEKGELYDRYTIRALLEGHAGELACRLGDPQAIAADLEANCDRLEAALRVARNDDLVSLQALTELNHEFHQRILVASGSATTARLLEALRMPLAYRLYIWRVPESRQSSLDYHRAIARAFRAGDPLEVRRLIEGHVNQARDHLMSGQSEPAPLGAHADP